MDISIVIANKIATLVTPIDIVCGNSDYTITFTFDDEWYSHDTKTARFIYSKRGKKMYEDVRLVGNTVKVPVLSNIHEVFVGVYAGELNTTTQARIECEKSILCDIFG